MRYKKKREDRKAATPSIFHEKTIATILNRLMLEFLPDLEFDKIRYKGLAYKRTSIIRGYLKSA